MIARCFLILFLTASLSGPAFHAADWPQFLGPNRNGVYSGPSLAVAWPKEGPRTVWQKKVGEGFSAPVVSSGKLILFHRLEDREIVECLEAKTGASLWKFNYPTTYRDDYSRGDGPRATPTLADGKVFSFGAEGALHCLDLAHGKKLWSVDVKERFSASKGFFGMACSPLVEGNHVLLNIGGSDGAGILALDKSTGQLAWKATDHEASYSSPVTATFGDRRSAVFFTRNGLVMVDPQTGKVQIEFPWRPRIGASVSAATPLIIGNQIFLSASYDTGAILLTVNGNKVRKVWSSDDALSNHYATSVYHDGFLFGFHGRQESGPSLRCIESKSGAVKWSADRLSAGTVTLVGEHLLILLEDGRLMLAPASPARFQAIAQAHVLPFGVRAFPALADGYFYARSKDKLVCLDLAGKHAD